MSEYSIIEFVVYGLVGYSGIIMLLSTAFRTDTPNTKSGAIIRSIWTLPAIYCLVMLAGISGTIYLDEGVTTNELVYNGTDSSLITNSTTTQTANSIVLVNPIWGTVHIVLYMMLIVYFIWNVLQLLVKRE